MGIIFKGPGYLVQVVAGFWGLFICLGIVYDLGGTILAVLSLFLFPAVLALAPWYSGIFLGEWFPLLLVYGGSIVGMGLIGIGIAIDGD